MGTYINDRDARMYISIYFFIELAKGGGGLRGVSYRMSCLGRHEISLIFSVIGSSQGESYHACSSRGSSSVGGGLAHNTT